MVHRSNLLGSGLMTEVTVRAVLMCKIANASRFSGCPLCIRCTHVSYPLIVIVDLAGLVVVTSTGVRRMTCTSSFHSLFLPTRGKEREPKPRNGQDFRREVIPSTLFRPEFGTKGGEECGRKTIS